MSLKSKIYADFVFNLDNFTPVYIFTRAPPMVPVTIIRYAGEWVVQGGGKIDHKGVPQKQKKSEPTKHQPGDHAKCTFSESHDQDHSKFCQSLKHHFSVQHAFSKALFVLH